MASRSLAVRSPAYGLLCLFLASLSVKALQEVGGIRVVSTCVPALLLALLPGVRLRLPKPIALYLICTCFLQTALSIVVKGAPNIYEGYLVITVLAALAVLIVCVDALRLDLRSVLALYADIAVFMCLASVFTVQEQWFGGFSLRGYSDFATFFALQVSVGVPFLAGRFVNAKRAVCLVALFFSFSRVSFALALVVVLVQLFQENRKSFVTLAPLLLGGVILLGSSTSIGGVMVDKFANVFSAALGGTAAAEINPSDLGRLAYATVTIESLDNPWVMLVGHGIKTNRDIVGAGLDISAWGLDEDLADATVHNVYIELLSDSGLFGALGFVGFLCFAAYRIARRYGLLSPPSLCIAIFAVSYLFEANYVSFFFEFFMCSFLWLASAPHRRRAATAPCQNNTSPCPA